MNNQQLLELLEAVRTGAIPPQEAASILGHSGYEDLGYAKVDHHRAARQGAAEVIFGQGKSPEQIVGIVNSLIGRGVENIIITLSLIHI